MPALHDVIIVGAGPVGASLALALADADLDVVVLDARAANTVLRSERSLALSHGARLIFERLGVWSDLAGRAGAVTPITDIDISQAGGFGMAQLHARDHGLPALGYVVSYRALQASLDAALARTRIAVRYEARAHEIGGTRAFGAVTIGDAAEAILGELVAVADGGGARIDGIARARRDYHQTALTAKVWCREPHRGLAYERFTPAGPVALLPEQDHYALVWTGPPAAAERLLELDDQTFLARLGAHFGRRREGFVAVQDRRTFPLALEFATSVVGKRVAVVGNAAQALHPVAGQGFNVGLRDAYDLARLVRDAPRAQIGDAAMLARYARTRRPDRLAGIAFTHGLVRLFSNAAPWLRLPRGAALTFFDALPSAKFAFTRTILFGLR